MMPPAIRKAGREIPMAFKKRSPTKAKTTNTKKPTKQARLATCSRYPSRGLVVKAKNSGIFPIGSITTKSMVNIGINKLKKSAILTPF